jgi:hypothetical protein
MSGNGALRTDDLALAVLLIMKGTTYELARGVREQDGFMRRTCFWVFPSTPQSEQLKERYYNGSARVEPQKFVRTWGVVRREMIDFLQ